MTVRGVGIHVYSITRTAGHGYVRLTGYEDFTGGMVEVGNRIILPIADNMLITAPAGIYRVTLCKGVSIASKTATVQQDQTVTVDFRIMCLRRKILERLRLISSRKGQT